VAVEYTQELLDRAQEYVDKSVSDRRYEAGLTELTSLYTAITGDPVGKCRQCQVSDYMSVVNGYTRAATRFLHPELMPESKYTIAPGLENETFVHEGYNKAVKAENLEDADAEFFISKGFTDAFILKAGQSADGEGDKEPKLTEKQQLQARYKELFGEDADEKLTIAQLKEAIKAKEDPE